jgi:excisionase family DNA binding protein
MTISTRKGPETRTSARDELLSPEQLAAHLGIGRTLTYQILAQKRIPSFTIGKLRRVRRVDVDRYVEECLSAEAR